ncbi:MAG: TetR family transcriptional regulator [Nocardioides sp.]|nr:TetR family transcriptional regulator [Nocardioides sp.]
MWPTATPAPRTTRVGQRVLEAASALFYERGITAVGVELVAEQAQTTKRTLYQRFGSKDGLVTAYLRRRAHAWQTTVLDALAARWADPAEALPSDAVRCVLEVAERWAALNPGGCAFVHAWAELRSTSSDAVVVIREEKRWMRDLFAVLTADDDLAEQLHLVYEGAQVTASTLSDPTAWARACEVADRLVTARARSADQPPPSARR